MIKVRKYFLLGVALLAAFFLQLIIGLRWEWLENLQKDPVYRVVSGSCLLAFVLFQWGLTFLRTSGPRKWANRHYNLHKQVGCFAPLLFYIHATRLGYAYLFLLSVIYLANAALGLFNQETMHWRSKLLNRSWMVSHVSLSVLTLTLIGYHLYIVIAYK